MLTNKEKMQLLSQAFWDRTINPDALCSFVNGDVDSVPDIESKSIFIRLLSSFDWYTLQDILDKEVLGKALSDNVLNALYPKSLKIKYDYVRQILFP